MPTKDELIERAERSGMDVDGRWSKDTLIEEMEKAGIPTEDAAPKGKTVPVYLHKDVWGDPGPTGMDTRYGAGSVVDLPVEQAKKLIKGGFAERADPMPGDD